MNKYESSNVNSYEDKDDDSNEHSNNEEEEEVEDDDDDNDEEKKKKKEEEEKVLKNVYPRLVLHTCEGHDRGTNQLCTFENSQGQACAENRIDTASAIPNLDKISPFFCSMCSNLITKREARHLPLLPIWHV